MRVRDGTGGGAKPKWNPSVLEICVLALVIGASGWGLNSLGNMIESQLTGMREETISNLFETLDYDISYRDISPSLLRAFEIRDLTIAGRESPDSPLVSIRHLRLRYSLSRLVTSRDPVSALREIQLVDSDFTLDLEGDRGLGILLQALSVAVSGGEGSAGRNALPPMNLAGANLGVIIEGRGTRVELRELYFRVRAGERLRITASGNVAALLSSTVSPALAGNEFLETDFRISGTAAADFSTVDATVRVPDLATSSFATGPLTLQVVADGDSVHIAKVDDRLPLDLEFAYDLGSGRIEVRLDADNLPVADAAQFSDVGPALQVLQDAVVTGSARWVRDPAAGTRYDGDIRARVAAADGRPAAEVVVAASGDSRRVVVSRLDAQLEQAGIQFVGDVQLDPFSPQGDLVVTAAPGLLGGAPLHAHVTLRRNGSGVDLRGDRVVFGDTVVGLSASLSPVGGGQPRFRYQARLALEQDAAHSISSSGVLDLRSGAQMDFAARLTHVAAGTLYRLAAAPDQRQPWLVTTLDPLLVSGTISGRTDFASVQLGRSTLEVVDRSEQESQLRFRIGRDQDYWLLDGLVAQWGSFRLRGDARITPAEDGIDVAADFTVNGEPLVVQVAHRPGQGITASGSHQLRLDGEYLAAGGVSFRGSVTELPIPWTPRQPPLKTTMAFSGALAESAEWSLRSDAVTVAGIPFLDRRQARLEFGFRASAAGVSLEPVRLRDSDTELTGSGSVTYGGETGAVAGRLALSDAANREHITVAASLERGQLDGRAEVSGMPLTRIGEFPISGDLRASVTASGPMQELAWRAAVNLDNGQLNEEQVSLAANVELAPSGLVIDHVSFDLLSHHLRNGRLTYDRDSANAQFDADYHAVYFGDSVAAHLRVTADNLGPGDDGTLSGVLASGVQAVLHTSALQVAGAPLDDWQLQLSVANGNGNGGRAGEPPGAARDQARADVVVHFDGGPHQAFRGFISTLGEFQVHVRGEPYPLRGTATGSISGGVIAAELELEEADALVINEFLGNSPISIESGRASGTARVAGPLSDPDFWGQLHVAGGSVTSPISPQVIGPFSVDLALEEKELSISGFASETTGALPLTVGGVATVERWIPADFRLELATTGATGVAIDYQFGPLQFDGYATGAVTVAGAGERVAISGSVQAVQANISIAEVAAGQGRADALAVDLAITTGRSVEFTWPIAQFPILRVMLVPSEQVRIGYDGLAGSFSVDGSVDVRSGDLFYFNRQFRLREGRIGFSENQNRFDPRLEVRAETRERDANGDPVRIILEAETTLSQFSPDTVRLASDPPQSALALDALVRDPLAGENAEVTGGAGMSAAAFSGDLLAQVALLQPVERALREALGVDMVSIRSPFVQNLVLDGLATPAEDGSAVTVGNPLDNTSLSFGKYLGSDLFLTMLLRLDTPGDSSPSEPPLLSDIELSLEWATPFFMLEWSFLPRNANTLFVTDNAITLRWGWRY